MEIIAKVAIFIYGLGGSYLMGKTSNGTIYMEEKRWKNSKNI
jgi:hypothetical protein